jgi:hypothetical protein
VADDERVAARGWAPGSRGDDFAIRTADADRQRLDEDLAVLEERLGHIAEHELAGIPVATDAQRTHLGSPLVPGVL